MNKTELVAAVAERAELSRKDADAAICALVETITDALKDGDKDYKAFVGELESVFAEFSRGGKVTVKYNTKCYLGSF